MWLSRAIAEKLFQRSRPHLPPWLGSEEDRHALPVTGGINARLRLYRYHPGALYRPHVDGSWPGSGPGIVAPAAPEAADVSGPSDPAGANDGGRGRSSALYEYDAFGDRWSRLTFLVYLNDDFEGGHTNFYTPGREEGIVEARGVAPRKGSVLVFPHGGSMGSLVHEGSAVTRGAKYVIRSDVLYMTERTGDE